MNDFDRIAKVIRHIDRHHTDQPSLAELARVAGLSEFHFHRVFSRWAGTTPKSFVKFLTASHAKSLLRDSRDVMSAALESGLSGPSRLHDLMITVEASTPGQVRSGGRGLEIRFGTHETPFGVCEIGVTDRGVCHLSFEGRGFAGLRKDWPNATFIRDDRQTARVVREIFAPKKSEISVLLRGTPFQLKVWEALLRIPPGHVTSYGALAQALGSPGASRALGSAVGANSVAYLIPCHRVIRETGALGGYRWGLERKKALLAWESARRR